MADRNTLSGAGHMSLHREAIVAADPGTYDYFGASGTAIKTAFAQGGDFEEVWIDPKFTVAGVHTATLQVLFLDRDRLEWTIDPSQVITVTQERQTFLIRIDGRPFGIGVSALGAGCTLEIYIGGGKPMLRSAG